jgi:hypothetical protein
MLCVLVFLACYAAAWPVAQMGFVDDWSYASMVRIYAETGHFAYNGWTNAMLGWMIPWGALFVKLFGFSFMVVKLSTLPVAVGTLLLFHAVLRRFEISPRNAVIGTLTLGLSPLFLPLSASFMTDIPGLFVIVLCLYCCQRAALAGSDRAAIGWLAAAALSNVVGGTARQVAWLGVLVMVPCTGWLLRKRRRVLAASAVLWVLGGGAVLYCMRWFAAQPYTVPMGLEAGAPSSVLLLIAHVAVSVNIIGAMLLLLLLMVCPVLLTWVRYFGKSFDDWLVLLCLGALPLIAVKPIFGAQGEIWPPDILLMDLAFKNDAGLHSALIARHTFMPIWVQILVSLLLIAAVRGCLFQVRNPSAAAMRESSPKQAERIRWLIVPFASAYFAALMLFSLHTILFDRYVLGVVPFAIVALLWLYQRFSGRELPHISVVILVLLGWIGVAGTHNWFAWDRARLAAIAELRAAGIPRTEIQGGYEYDGWTQLKAAGRIDDPRIENPPNLFRPRPPIPGISSQCEYWFIKFAPAVIPKYSVAVMPSSCYLPSRFPSVHYTAWLPPFERTLEVQRVPQSVGEVRH